jgi:hypothetical protein
VSKALSGGCEGVIQISKETCSVATGHRNL